jgi:hypothetical protein
LPIVVLEKAEASGISSSFKHLSFIGYGRFVGHNNKETSMKQHSFRDHIFAEGYSKRLISLSLMAIFLLSFLFFTGQNTSAHNLVDTPTTNSPVLYTNTILQTGVIGDYVWLDSNGNGLQDAGEPGVAGVEVTLYNAANDAVVATTTTDSDGFYAFTDLEGGDYYVGFTLPAQSSFTVGDVDGQGIDGPFNSDVITQTASVGYTEAFSLGEDETNPNVDAGLLPSCHSLDWPGLGFEPGNSGPQTFLNVAGSGVDMTVEISMYNAAFEEIGPYIHPDGDYPTVNGNALAVRGIDPDEYPNAGMIVSKITFSDPISLNGLWFEPFYFWTQQNLRKEMGLQLFDTEGDGIVPGFFSVYGGSDLVIVNHPANNQPWLRSDFPNSQTTYSGAFSINYGSQAIQEIHWYSWTTTPDGQSFSNTIGSSYFNGFTFCRVTPTAVSLIDLQSSNLPALPWVATLVAMVFMTGLLLVARRRQEVSG